MLRTEPRDDPTYETKSDEAGSLTGRFATFVARTVVLDTVIVTTLFVLACWQYLPLVNDTPFHRDEARWVHRASYVRELAHPFGAYWDEVTWIERGGSLDEQYRLRAQPPLGSYLMGLGLLLQGRDLDVNGFWNMDRDERWNVSQGNMPHAADLTAAHRTTAIVTALTVVVVFALGRRLTNRVGGVTAALFLLFHPLVNLYAAFAGSDMLLVFLVALAAMAAYRLADRPSWPRALLLGVVLGLGAAAKLSPLGVTIPLALLGGAVVARHYLEDRVSGTLSGTSREAGYPARSAVRFRWFLAFVTARSSATFGWQLVSLPLVALATLVATYPYLWRAPFDHTLAMFEFRTAGMDLQARLWPHIAVASPFDALRRVGLRLGEEFTILGRLGAGWEVPTLELGVAAVGLLVLLFLVARHGLTSGHGLALVVLGGQSAITVIGMDADWARYHLPILLFVAICIGVVIGQGWTVARRALPVARPFLSRSVPENR